MDLGYSNHLVEARNGCYMECCALVCSNHRDPIGDYDLPRSCRYEASWTLI